MKRTLSCLLVAGVAFGGATLIVVKRQAARHATIRAAQAAAWESERADFEAALEAARRHTQFVPIPAPDKTTAAVPAPAQPSATELLEILQGLRVSPGGSSARVLREAVYRLEELARLGPAALPVIGEFLARYEDVEFDSSQLPGRNARDWALDFAVPPSLRFGLFDVVRRIGGREAEEILAAALARTGRGAEVAWLARALQEMAPDKYRGQALAVTRALLAGSSLSNSAGPLDRNHRDYLFGVLTYFGDAGFASEAQTQLVRGDGQLDRGALRYLQSVMGAQAVPIAAQAYQNPLLTNSASREPLARLALSYVGSDAQADAFYQTSINDPVLNKSHRKNLIEDLNQDGFPDTKNLTPRDLPLIQNRLALIEQLAPGTSDEANRAAFQEAYKDLLNMQARITGRPPSPKR